MTIDLMEKYEDLSEEELKASRRFMKDTENHNSKSVKTQIDNSVESGLKRGMWFSVKTFLRGIFI
jgi:hypothetical protein